MMDKAATGASGQGLVLSVVVPIYNEADNIGPFLQRLERALDGLDGGYEVVCVDDGSSDASAERWLEERQRNPAIKLVRLSRNFGKELALTAGLDHAMGAAVVVIDADQQDPPELIPELLAKGREGFDVVHARRASRQGDGPARKPGCSSRFED